MYDEVHSVFYDAVEGYNKENKAFGQGNQAAGTRARKHLMRLINAATAKRKEIQDIKNAK